MGILSEMDKYSTAGERHQAVAHDITSATMLYYGQLFVKI